MDGAAVDTQIRGRTIRAGQKVVMWNMSANRDEEVFADPDRFDVGRTPNHHLSLGAGAHFCLGASLARLELRVLFEELLARVDKFELTGEPRMLRANNNSGIKHLPVLLTTA